MMQAAEGKCFGGLTFGLGHMTDVAFDYLVV